MNTYESRLAPCDQVYIDNDQSIAARIIRVSFDQSGRAMHEVSWFNNGAIQTAWVEEYRLVKAS